MNAGTMTQTTSILSMRNVIRIIKDFRYYVVEDNELYTVARPVEVGTEEDTFYASLGYKVERHFRKGDLLEARLAPDSKLAFVQFGTEWIGLLPRFWEMAT